ncbi:MAG: hypothetical protein K2H38_12070 [Muribaculaceae bacterium]|nr:hypothetical protein [Muribaculaceae bacterium]MDE6553149.1 hypothetical protein [Muribaculaceae bacterium]
MEKEILTPGQKAVIDGYLEAHKPGESFEQNRCLLFSTQEIIDELAPMCDFDLNTLSDYLASIGYRYHYDNNNGIHGWIFSFPDNP